MTGSVFASSYIQVNILPVFLSFFGNKAFMVFHIHISEKVPRTSRPSGHGVEFEGENIVMVILPRPLQRRGDNSIRFGIPIPIFSSSQWWFAFFGGKVFFNLGKSEGQAIFRDGIRKSVFIINRERFSPVPLPAEYSIAQSIIGFSFSKANFFKLLN